MSDPRIRQALETHLAALDNMPTAYQNVEFDPPAGVPFQEAYVLPAPGRTLGLRQKTTLHRGIFQVNLCYPAGSGAGDVEARGKLLQAHFSPSETVLESGGVKVRIAGKPVIGAPVPGRPGLYVVPVSIRYESTF